MSELDERARALFRGARADYEPDAAARSQLERKLMARLAAAGSGAAIATTATSSAGAAGVAATTSALAPLKWIVGCVLVVGAAAGVGSAYRTRPSPLVANTAIGAAIPTAIRAPDAPSPTSEAPAAAPPEPQPSAAPKAATKSRSPSPVSTASVADEVRLLRKADKLVRSGDAAAALALLDEHRRAHPNGALSEERTAERIFALCKAGRTTEARAEANRFLSQRPRSPLAPNVRAACPASNTTPPR